MRQNKNNKRAAYRRGEKASIFLRKGMIFFAAVILIAVIGLGLKLAANAFTVSNIIVSGNHHLENQDVIKSSGIRRGESLLELSFKDVEKSAKKNFWIKGISMRKEFPDTVSLIIEESTPKALLSLRGETSLVDARGEVLDKISGEGTPFLPVIKDIDPLINKEAIIEALDLVDVLSEKKRLEGKESIEIWLESYGLAMKIDGDMLKVGYGKYTEKFDKWKSLEPEIRKMETAVEYVDLRFDDVIVQPVKKEEAVKPVKKEETAETVKKDAAVQMVKKDVPVKTAKKKAAVKTKKKVKKRS
ncbi:MAG: FtsQ-type POTRA domain-containing protein [Thermodesulfovibrionia bacterium]|nr:FtsQ-type POTRA domain-containing protein [Thermodesulfovibrionia bacterium]